jgi:hypothetical protein
MKLPTFFSVKKAATPATASELLAKVTEAEAAHKAALERVEAARAALATERTAEALAAHRTAVSEAADVEVMLGILRDEHAAAAAGEAAAERVRIHAKLEELNKTLARDGVLEAGREEAETEARLLVQLAQCRVRRRELRDHFLRLEHDRNALLLQLGKPAKQSFGGSDADGAISPEPVLEILKSKAEPNTLLAGFLNGAKPTYKTYWPSENRFEA